MNEATTFIVGLLSGAAGVIGGVWLLRCFLGTRMEPFFALALQNRATAPDLEFRKQQLSEFYGPIYAYSKLNEQLYAIWRAGKLQDINAEMLDLFRRQSEQVLEILATKLHLAEGDQLPPAWTDFMTAVTLRNIYAARRGQPWVPDPAAELPQAKHPTEFDLYIYETTERLKRTIGQLHRKYGIM